MTIDDPENGSSLRIPGWFVRLNLIVMPFIVAPMLSWLIWKAINNSDRIGRQEGENVDQQRQIDSLRSMLDSVSEEQRRRTALVYPE